MTLTALPTHHGLPPRWDGCAVLWDDWAEHATSMEFHTPIKDRACRVCGSVERPLRATGQVAVMPEVTHDQLRGANAMRKGGKYGLRRLFASRCRDCSHDQVLVMPVDDPTGDWDLFDLEPRDYGDEGSTDPTTDQGALF